MKIEVNPSPNYEYLTHIIIINLSRFHKAKPFSKMKRDDIITYLNSVRKTDIQDPLHKWIGTYNLYLTCITRFFKWFYYPNENPKNRPKPEVINNIPQLKRKETSVYKPSNLWTLEDDLLFLKWCSNKRDRCYHAISRDLSGRPHEILNLKIKDIVFKSAANKQYAEVLVNGKTGTRHLPLIDSLPYVKEWLDAHPQRNNSNAYLICSSDRRFANRRPVSIRGLYRIYLRYQRDFFPNLLNDQKISSGDKNQIRDLLKKPWNPYIRRHSSLTQKSKYLKENILRQHAGWSPRSNMHQKYVHYFGNESSESILQEYGILPRDNEENDSLRPKYCTNCQEPNRPDQKFCVKCRMVLSIEAFQDTLEEQREKDEQIKELIRRVDQQAQRLDMQDAFLSDPEKFIKMRDEAIALGPQQKKSKKSQQS